MKHSRRYVFSFSTYLNVLASDQGFIDSVAVMYEDRNFTNRIYLPKPVWFILKLTVDDAILNILGVETERRPLSVGAETHIDESHGFLVDWRHGE